MNAIVQAWFVWAPIVLFIGFWSGKTSDETMGNLKMFFGLFIIIVYMGFRAWMKGMRYFGAGAGLSNPDVRDIFESGICLALTLLAGVALGLFLPRWKKRAG